MDFDNYRELKSNFIKKWNAELVDGPILQLQDLDRPAPPDYQIGIGASFNTAKDFNIEVRIQNAGSRAAEAAEEVKEAARDEANVRVVPRLQILPIHRIRELLSKKPSPLGAKLKPIYPGASVSVAWGGTGTLGGFVFLEDGGAGIVSNNHVLARMGRAKSELEYGLEDADKVFQPGGEDSKARTPDFTVGKLHSFVDFSTGRRHSMDVAVARLTSNNRTIGGNVLTQEMGAPKEIKLLEPMEILDLAQQLGRPPVPAKLGRTSGFTTGSISAFDISHTLDTEVGNLTFEAITEISSDPKSRFSDVGDSGSAVFDLESGIPFGLHFAGGHRADDTTYYSFCCSLPACLDAMMAKWML